MDNFDKSKDQILQRGIIDPYDLSDEPGEWVVLCPYIFWSARVQKAITVPRWFRTDLASIPRSLRSLISVNEQHRLAAILHDLGYRTLDKSKIAKDDWDELLRDFSLLQGLPEWKADMMYAAVHHFGKTGNTKFLIPADHREWYKKQFPQLDLDTTDMEYEQV